MQRIAIIGAGAVGSALGALLRRAGHDVVLVGRQAHVGAIRAGGLQVDGVLGAFGVKIDAAVALDERPDLAFLTVKTQDVTAALQACGQRLQGVPVVTFQNGVRSDDLVASVLPAAQIISAVVNFHASFLQPGAVTISYAGPLVIGRPHAANDARVEQTASLLRAAFPTEVSANIRGVHWLKLIVNLNNALPALTNLPMADVYQDAYLRQLSVRIMREGVLAARRAGIGFASLPDVPARSARLISLLPLPLAGRFAAASHRRMASRWPLLGSTLQSLRRHRPTEIDFLNGEVVRLGRQLGLPTPINATIVDRVHEVERGGGFMAVAKVREAIEAAVRGARP